MSRLSQDTFGILRGAQLVARASLQCQQQNVAQLWKNSSVREVVESNAASTQQCMRAFAQNPTKEFEKLYGLVKETAERSSVVAEGFRQYTASAVTQLEPTIPQQSLSTSSPGNMAPNQQPLPISYEPSSLDVTSITLKELELILSRRNKNKNTSNVVEPPASVKINTTIPDSNTKNDEKYVEEWMSFIAKAEPNKSSTEPTKATTDEPKQPTSKEPKKSQINLPELSSVAKQRSVPSSRLGRMASFGTLFAGLGLGTVNELAKGALGIGGSTSVKEALFSANNTERIVDTLCKVRGAALKIGQILSIQDSALVSPEMIKAFDRVRQAADYMPDWQVEKCMSTEFGPNWRTEHLSSFDEKPFAAASIGQVHRAVLRENGMSVAIKIQYPGVARSISSDIDNLVGMLKVWDVFPAGFFIDNIVKVD